MLNTPLNSFSLLTHLAYKHARNLLLLQSLFRKYENRQIVVSGQAAFKPMKLGAKPILSVTMLVCFSDFLDDNNPMRCYNQPTFIEK